MQTESTPMTLQQIFDSVWEYFVINKNPQSIDPDTGKCMYRCVRADNTVTRCAAGIFIPNELYTPEIENKRAATLEQNFAGPVEGVLAEYLRANVMPDPEHRALVDLLQRTHDDYRPCLSNDGGFAEYMDRALRRVAKDYKLVAPAAATEGGI